mmetsp:Transcript_474/g.1362  ORF Transcript_474/g.1362 Transcript_474/m.1362 type:complete len:273 (+) Transcript_474:809-1627(+)
MNLVGVLDHHELRVANRRKRLRWSTARGCAHVLEVTDACTRRADATARVDDLCEPRRLDGLGGSREQEGLERLVAPRARDEFGALHRLAVRHGIQRLDHRAELIACEDALGHEQPHRRSVQGGECSVLVHPVVVRCLAIDRRALDGLPRVMMHVALGIANTPRLPTIRCANAHEARAAAAPQRRRTVVAAGIGIVIGLGVGKPAFEDVHIDGVRLSTGVVRPQLRLEEAHRVEEGIGPPWPLTVEGDLLRVGEGALGAHNDTTRAVDVARRP